MGWHLKYGHINFQCLKEIAKNNIVLGLKPKECDNEPICEVCFKSKITVKLFVKSQSKAKSLLEIVHSNICGPVHVLSIAGSIYFITFIDDCSRFIVIYFLKTKDSILNDFKDYKSLV